MKYIHSVWSKPSKNKNYKNKDNDYVIKNFIYFLYGTLLIKKHGYSIDLYCDENSYKIYKKIPYDNIHVVDFNDDEISPAFWNWSKIKSQLMVNEPYAHIDGDVLLFNDVIGDKLTNKKYGAVVQSVENDLTMGGSYGNTYLQYNLYKELPNFNVDWNKHNMWSYNCGVMGFSDMKAKDEYLNLVKDIFKYLSKNENRVRKMGKYDNMLIIAEQLVLYYYLKENNIKTLEILDYNTILEKYSEPYGWLRMGDDIGYCHMWGYSKYNVDVINQLKLKLRKHYPRYRGILNEFEKNYEKNKILV